MYPIKNSIVHTVRVYMTYYRLTFPFIPCDPHQPINYNNQSSTSVQWVPLPVTEFKTALKLHLFKLAYSLNYKNCILF